MQGTNQRKNNRCRQQTLSLSLTPEILFNDASGASNSEQLSEKLTAGTGRKGTGIAWNQSENLLYVDFLKRNEDLFSFSDKQRQEAGVHILMSKHIQTRSSVQCRSHHQKMLKKYKSVAAIIREVKRQMRSTKKVESQPNIGSLSSRWAIELIDCSELQRQEKEVTVWNQAISDDSKQADNDHLIF